MNSSGNEEEESENSSDEDGDNYLHPLLSKNLQFQPKPLASNKDESQNDINAEKE